MLTTLANPPDIEALAELGDAKTDIVEISILQLERDALIPKESLSASYQLSQTLLSDVDTNKLKYVVITDAGKDNEKVTVLSKSGFEVDEEGLSLVTSGTKLQLNLVEAIVYAVEVDAESISIIVSNAIPGEEEKEAGGGEVVSSAACENPLFESHVVYSLLGDAIVRAKAVDLDRDGDMDIVSTSNSQGIRWHENDGAQQFTAHQIRAGSAFEIEPIDLDQDGDIDLVVGSVSTNDVDWYKNDGQQTFTRMRMGSFKNRTLFPADLDGDGDLDVVFGSLNDPESNHLISWYQYNGANYIDGTLGTEPDVRSLRVGDMDGDGDLDLVTASYSTGTISLWKNSGSAVFTKSVIATGFSGTQAIAIADIDKDGRIDVIAAADATSKISWIKNSGEDTWPSYSIVTEAANPRYLVGTDLDADGDLDILSANSQSNETIWYENEGNQSFLKRTISDAEGDTHSVLPADLDGDGDLDLITASITDGNIKWFEQTCDD